MSYYVHSSGRRLCPTGKVKYFNEAWAQIAADEQTEKYGIRFKVYRCHCRWWHTYDRRKKRTKDNVRESPKDRKRRSRRGEPPPVQTAMEQKRREEKRLNRYRYKVKKSMPIRVWEDDGGYIPIRED